MIITSTDEAQAELARLVAQSQRATGFSGAGISTECGVPDFRSPNSPWMKHRPIDFSLFLADPLRFADAHRLYALDSMEHLAEYHARHPISIEPTPGTKARMKLAMAAHLRETCFGGRCQIEDFTNTLLLAIQGADHRRRQHLGRALPVGVWGGYIARLEAPRVAGQEATVR